MPNRFYWIGYAVGVVAALVLNTVLARPLAPMGAYSLFVYVPSTIVLIFGFAALGKWFGGRLAAKQAKR